LLLANVGRRGKGERCCTGANAAVPFVQRREDEEGERDIM